MDTLHHTYTSLFDVIEKAISPDDDTALQALDKIKAAKYARLRPSIVFGNQTLYSGSALMPIPTRIDFRGRSYYPAAYQGDTVTYLTDPFANSPTLKGTDHDHDA